MFVNLTDSYSSDEHQEDKEDEEKKEKVLSEEAKTVLKDLQTGMVAVCWFLVVTTGIGA